jgi:hypothetical protein
MILETDGAKKGQETELRKFGGKVPHHKHVGLSWFVHVCPNTGNTIKNPEIATRYFRKPFGFYIQKSQKWWAGHRNHLVGGLEHEHFLFFYILGIVINPN